MNHRELTETEKKFIRDHPKEAALVMKLMIATLFGLVALFVAFSYWVLR